jgi:hypothetical protein
VKLLAVALLIGILATSVLESAVNALDRNQQNFQRTRHHNPIDEPSSGAYRDVAE